MRQIEVPVVGNSQAIATIGYDALAYFNEQLSIHEMNSGFLNL